MSTRWSAGGRRDRTSLLVTVVFLVLTIGLVGVAMIGPLLALIACIAAVGLVSLVAFGAYRVAVVLLMGAFAVAPVYRGLIPALGGGITPADLLLAGGFGLMVPLLLQRRLRLPLLYVLGVSIVVVFGLVASALADAPFVSFQFLLNWMSMMVVLPVAIALWGPSGREVTALLWSYVAGHAASVIVAVAEGPIGNDRYQGLTHHPNAFGEAGLTAFAIGLFLWHRHRGKLSVQVLLVLCQGLSLLSIVLSGSRAALVITAVLILFIPIVERSALLGFTIAISGALALMAFNLTARFAAEGTAISRLAGNDSTTGSDEIRTDSRGYGIDRFLDHPLLGSGLEGVDYIHDLNLAVLVSIGVFGFAGYALVMFVFARPLFDRGEYRRLSYVAWSYLGLAPTVPSLWDRTTWLPMALSIVAVMEVSRRGLPDEAEAQERAPARPGARAGDAGVSPGLA